MLELFLGRDFVESPLVAWKAIGSHSRGMFLLLDRAKLAFSPCFQSLC